MTNKKERRSPRKPRKGSPAPKFESGENFRAMVEAAPHAMAIVDRQGRFVYANPKTLECFGYHREELIGNSVELLIPERFRKQHPHLRAEYLSDPKPRAMGAGRYLYGLRKDGSEFPIEIGLAPLSAGDEVLVLCSMIDITRRRVAEQILEENRSRLDAILESATDAILAASSDGTIILSNDAAVGLFGYRKDEMIGRPLTILMPERYRKAHEEGLRRRSESGSSRLLGTTIELHGLTKEGREFPIELSLSSWQTSSGKFYAGVIRDITERKRAEQSMAEQSSILTSILECLGEGVAVADMDGKFRLWNPAATQIVGLGAADIPKDKWSDHYGVYFPDKVTPYPAEDLPLARAMRGETVNDDEQFLRHPGAPQGVSLLVTGTPLVDEKGERKGGIAVFRDISDRKRMEEELKRRTAEVGAANKELEAFSYSVSHDLRSPLRAIDGFSRILLRDYAEKLDAEGRRKLNIVRESTVKMGQLIDDLLEFSRVGRKALSLERVDVWELANSVCKELAADEPDRSVEIAMESLPPARGDRGLLRQVFSNVIGNAFKYTRRRERPKVEITGIVDGERSTYHIRDNGAGFDMKYVEKLFGVFQRLHSDGEFPGTGVGLALVQRIVNRHGGKIWAEGQVDQGSVFSFTLPYGGDAHDRPERR